MNSRWRFSLETIFLVTVVHGTLAAGIPWFLRNHFTPALQTPFTVRTVGVMIFFPACAAYASTLWDLVRHGNGTPAVWDAPRVFVRRGLYRRTRNPMYLSLVLIVLGEAVFYRSMPVALYAAVLLAGFHLFVITCEEPVLRRKFSEAYTDYCRSVRRWI